MATRRFGLLSRLRTAALVAGAALGLLWAATANAQDVLPADAAAAQTVITLTPSDDATIDSAMPGTAFGALGELRVALQGQSQQATLIRFDLSAFPQGTTINKATLRLWQTSAVDGAPSLPLPVDQIFSDWDETKVTWETAPAVDNVGSPPLTSPNSANLAVEANVTALVDKWINQAATNVNYGLEIIPQVDSAGFVRSFASKESGRAPQLIIDYTLPPIRICIEQTDTCPPAVGALVTLVGGAGERVADASGYVDTTGLALGQKLWARLKVDSTAGGVRYITLPAAVTIEAARFGFTRVPEMRLAVTAQKPLWVQNLEFSAQWFVQASPADAGALRSRIVKASDYLYSFTDGQFALGDVRVLQSYDGWDAAHVQLFANNVLQPKAIIGGIVMTETADFAPTVPITYAPGVVSIGSYWNRFGSPPNSVNVFEGVAYNEVALADDWPLALAHEFGHYLLYLFDTYTGVDGVADLALTRLCTGTAMGDVYRPENQNFIFDPTHWNTKCNGTEAFARLNSRTEWQTIEGWYPWAVAPTLVVAGPAAPPTPLTNVTFVAPTVTPAAAAASLFDLEYQDNESSSGEARAFLYQAGRVVEQGKPPKQSLTVQVTGAQVGDRICVYDINDHAEGGESTRHQFVCEQIAAGDDNLVMTKDTAWDPEVSVRQVGAQQVQLVVTTTVPANVQVGAQIFPEHQTALAPIVLPRSGNVFSATVTLTQPVPALYAQVFVEEEPPLPATRREIVADRGTGGGGAFGPARAYGGALTVSSDGNASFEPDSDLNLLPGQSIAWQSMPGTPPLPFFKWISGQSYRLDAFPPALASNGTVHITFDSAFGMQAAASEGSGGGGAIHFWNGSAWLPLTTEVTTPAGVTDGKLLASARSQGVGVYAVLIDAPPGSLTYLPLLRVAK